MTSFIPFYKALQIHTHPAPAGGGVLVILRSFVFLGPPHFPFPFFLTGEKH